MIVRKIIISILSALMIISVTSCKPKKQAEEKITSQKEISQIESNDKSNKKNSNTQKSEEENEESISSKPTIENTQEKAKNEMKNDTDKLQNNTQTQQNNTSSQTTQTNQTEPPQNNQPTPQPEPAPQPQPSPQPTPQPQPTPEPTPPPVVERTWEYMSDLSMQTFNLMNSFRGQNSMPPMEWSEISNGRAKTVAYDCASREVIYHNASQIALGNGIGTAQSFINQWANSQGHRNSMLSEYNSEGAVAVYRDSNGRYYVIADFYDEFFG